MKQILMAGLLALTVSGIEAQPKGRGGPSDWQFMGAEAGRPGAVVKNAPFSTDITTETSMLLQDGNHIRQTSTLRFYRDSEGRTRREQSLNRVGGLATNANLPTVIFISDPVAGVNYALNSSAKTANRTMGGRGGRSSAAADGAPGRHGRGPGQKGQSQNVKTEALGRQTLEGVVADGTRTTVTIPAGQMGNEMPIQTVMESWYSPDLRTTVLSRRSDPRSGETVTKYTNIVRAEPAHSLFEVPADYKVSDADGRGPGTDAK
jgi:hypothetical protein